MDISEGIRRLGIVVFGLALLILAVTVFFAASAAIGTDVPVNEMDEPRLYQEQTGHDAWAQAQTDLHNLPPSDRLSMYQRLFGAGNLKISNEKDVAGWMVDDATRNIYSKILSDYFAAHPHAKTVRVRDWHGFQTALVIGLVISAAVAAFGWILLGFSGRTSEP
ncbi:hypothetical protein [Paraburkholderia aromaticivorans]|uniref:hypothetical protein n=1 Tax=Paraburkholderia aromaticivorans TaxID=2026199 RepID=UPI00145610E5|nr:hypothetical protein [Paraburkholderia aromaticivorans]